jgi:hypothetical protein
MADDPTTAELMEMIRFQAGRIEAVEALLIALLRAIPAAHRAQLATAFSEERERAVKAAAKEAGKPLDQWIEGIEHSTQVFADWLPLGLS